MTRTKKVTSPLGTLSAKYDELCPRTGHIWDNTEDEVLILRPAGFTKQDERRIYLPRQEYFKRIWERVARHGNPEDFYPLSQDHYSLEIVREPGNKYSKTAVHIRGTLFNLKAHGPDRASGGTFLDLGYIPEKISSKVYMNIKQFREVLIYSVEKDVHGKYYVANLALVYGEPRFDPEELVAGRMASVMED